jgi:hypothetical protein
MAATLGPGASGASSAIVVPDVPNSAAAARTASEARAAGQHEDVRPTEVAHRCQVRLCGPVADDHGRLDPASPGCGRLRDRESQC